MHRYFLGNNEAMHLHQYQRIAFRVNVVDIDHVSMADRDEVYTSGTHEKATWKSYERNSNAK